MARAIDVRKLLPFSIMMNSHRPRNIVFSRGWSNVGRECLAHLYGDALVCDQLLAATSLQILVKLDLTMAMLERTTMI